jgi:hypothetical protein
MRMKVWLWRAADLPHNLVTGAAADLVGLALGSRGRSQKGRSRDRSSCRSHTPSVWVDHPQTLLHQQIHMESWIPSHLLALRLWIASRKGVVCSQMAEVDRRQR